MTELEIAARDGRRLAATLYEPVGDARAAVLVASATAVRRRLYDRFASHLAAGGLAVLTFDYRGVGDSRDAPARRDPATMVDWGRLDVGGALDALRARYPGLALLYVGHSGGGWLLGMCDGTGDVAAVLTVASQDGHWRNWSGRQRLTMMLFWYGVMPLSIAVFRKLPGWTLGGAEDLPAGVARDWGRWGRSPGFLRATAARSGWNGYSQLAAPLRAYAIAGDLYAPPRAVERFLDLYPHARGEVRLLDPNAPGLEGLAHFSVFRPRYVPLWNEMREWLLAAACGPSG